MSKSLASAAHRNPMPLEGRRIVTNKDGSVTLSIPINFKRHGGRKYIIAPTEAMKATAPKESMLKALGRAFHWQSLIANDASLTHDDIAKKENFSPGYVSKIMHLTLLAPDVIEAILDQNYPKFLTLADIQKAGFMWDEQRRVFGLTANA